MGKSCVGCAGYREFVFTHPHSHTFPTGILQDLYLMGNPCTDCAGYHEFVFTHPHSHTFPAGVLQDLYLMGNPCADWPGYRQFVVASLPQLQRLDGTAIKPSDRIVAKQALPRLTQQLREELAAEGIDPDNVRRARGGGLLEQWG
eukprot:362520-Chlamydomonas_euryale.AAC.12